ncbi:restriction endonuclease subunit S [Nocardiopsis sp. M1B1]|uniref:restriction endonuclease subunit S n=1 Tax=Nocardiopsis sp. M1B1 TaxID=3450454 RepID=UPI0040396502
MNKWTKHTVKELEADGFLLVQDGNHGEYRPRRDEFSSNGVSFIRAADMHDGHILFSSAQRINKAARERIRKGIGKSHDVILSHKGTVGKVAFAPASSPSFVCSPQTTFWRSLDHSKISPRYLYFHLISSSFTSQLRALENSSDMAAYVSLTSQRGLSILLPPINEQHAIASALGALDDKISVNQRIADTSRQLGLALYKESITENSRSVTIEGLSGYLNRGQAPKYTEDEDGMTVLNQRCVRAGRVLLDPARRTLAARVQEARRLQTGDVLVNSTGVGTLGRVAIWSHTVEATVDSHVTIVRVNPEVTPTVVGGFAMLAAQQRIEALGEGSTGQTELSKAKLGQLEVEIPDGESGVLATRLTALEEKADAALAESRTLTELRDTLLPQLMSGKLRVKDAEKIVEDNV